GTDAADNIAVDGSGNVYVTGSSEAGFGAANYATIKYAPDGTRLWVKRYSGPNNLDIAQGLVLDANGNVYVTGESRNGTFDYLTVKYDTDGNLLWEARRDSGGTDAGVAITTDASGYVYVTGKYNNEIGTIKYDADGNELWLAVYESASAPDKSGIAIAVDA